MKQYITVVTSVLMALFDNDNLKVCTSYTKCNNEDVSWLHFHFGRCLTISFSAAVKSLMLS